MGVIGELSVTFCMLMYLHSVSITSSLVSYQACRFFVRGYFVMAVLSQTVQSCNAYCNQI
jgi:hypothetical protein